MSSVALKRVGRIGLNDLAAISEFSGRDFLPYPFVFRRPVEGDSYDNAVTAPDRFKHGDLQLFKPWFTTYMSADIRVECEVRHLGGVDTPKQRIMAHRSGQSGFIATQSGDDPVEVFALSPFELGPAVAGTAALTKPGKNPRIVIPEYVPPAAPRTRGDTEVGALAPLNRTGVFSYDYTKVPETAVTMYATAQSHWQPARNWGLDRYKRAIAWVGIKGDGDYIYTPDNSHATPLNARILSERINQLIAEDVLALRAFRGSFD